jgi:CheY-like chemotaxis protein
MAKIMVVDDEEDIRETVKALLESGGHNVTVAEDGDQCLQLVKKEKPDLVLMDVLMPGTPVDEILPKISDIKVIIFSVVTLGEERIAESGKDLPSQKDFPNVVDYIEKPSDINNILAKVKKALEK